MIDSESFLEGVSNQPKNGWFFIHVCLLQKRIRAVSIGTAKSVGVSCLSVPQEA